MSDRDNITLPREVACQVPLHELLESVPSDARLVIDDADGKGTRFIPVGRLCREAATIVRTHLAAEQPKPEPVAWMDRFGFVFRGKGPHETFTTPLYTAPPDIEALRRENERLREAIEAYIRAKDSDGGGKGGFFPKPPTVAHQRRVHLAWQELNAALRREETT